MRKVIFVGGTSFSGSTAFHLMLANDPGGFACGETESLFFPQRDGHVTRLNDAGPESLRIWQQAYLAGPERVYTHIFDTRPDVRFVVDSSKNPHWIRMQNELLRRQGIDVHNLLIWKTPLEFAQSRKKRNSLAAWQKEWRNAHRAYFTLIERWRAVQYRQLALEADTVLAAACAEVGIPFLSGKAEFWHKASHHLGGNYSARVHLHNGNEAERFMSRWINDDRKQRHKQVYYEEVSDRELTEEVDAVTRACPDIGRIEEALVANDIAAASGFLPPPARLRIAPVERSLRSARESCRRWLGNRLYGSQIKLILDHFEQERHEP